MAEYDIAEAAVKLPAAIEHLSDLATKLPQSGDLAVEIAKQTGAEQFIKDATAGQQTLYALAEQFKAFIGEEGDSATGEGTLYGALGAVRKINKAFNGGD